MKINWINKYAVASELLLDKYPKLITPHHSSRQYRNIGISAKLNFTSRLTEAKTGAEMLNKERLEYLQYRS